MVDRIFCSLLVTGCYIAVTWFLIDTLRMDVFKPRERIFWFMVGGLSLLWLWAGIKLFGLWTLTF